MLHFELKFTNRSRLTFVLPLTLLIFTACSGRPSGGDSTMQPAIPSQDVRRPAVAGSWYSDDADELRRELQGYLDQAQDFKLEGIIGLVSPHAGYTYSGPVAGYTYRQLVGKKYETVVVVAPSHVEAFPFSAVYGRGGYLTPLGLIPVDTALANTITRGRTMVQISDRGHRQEKLGRQEHSLEIQLPFLQLTLKEFKIVPIVMGDQSEEAVNDLTEAIVQAAKGKNVLLVASSDLSHFHSYEEAKRIDAGVLKRLEEYNTDSLLTDLDFQKVEACGGGPICVVMAAAQALGADHSQVLRYANSGDVPAGDRYRVVGYVAAAFNRSRASQASAKKDTVRQVAAPSGTQQLSRGDAAPLSAEDKKTLMRIARTTIEKVVKREPVPEFTVTSPDLLQNRGAFVTITKGGQLRGCIGYIIGVKPLYQTVREVAESAALRDPRFEPVQPDELPDLKLEISALSPPRKIKSVEEIQVGIHGIIMRRGYHQGLLLPQVATDYGWDRKTFLEQTCRKAGLPTNAWQDEETEIQVFSAEVFGEE